jgi:isocitrate dehydrogenase
MTFTTESGETKRMGSIYDFEGDGVAMCMYKTDESIYGFAQSSFQVALDIKNGRFICRQKNTF